MTPIRRAADVHRQRPPVRRTLAAALAALACMTWTAAPAAGADRPTPQQRDRIIGEQVISIGFAGIAEVFLQPVDMKVLSIDGLRGLSRIDPAIRASIGGGAVRLKVGDAEVGEITAPDRNEAGAWAAVTVRAVERLRIASRPLAAAGPEDIYQALFDAIAADLDGYSRYTSAARANDERSQREGYGAVGVTLARFPDHYEVRDLVPDGPAAQAGLVPGDRVQAIDGEPVAGLDMEQVGERLRGPAGTMVSVTVARSAGEVRRLTLRRERLIPNTVETRTDGPVGILKVERFNAATAVNLKDGLRRIRRDLGREPAGLILDLRGNPGGLLDQAVAVADQFMASGRIISTKGRHPDSLQVFDATPDDIADGIPMVVLIDGRSASAAEVVAAALQDSGRAVVVGASSFGKGSVQKVTRLPNNGELFITWSRIHAPSGYTLHKQGIHPTVCTSNDVAAVEDALRPLRGGAVVPPSTLALWRAKAPEDQAALDRLRQACPWKDHAPELDVQVARALLADGALYRRAVMTSQTNVAER